MKLSIFLLLILASMSAFSEDYKLGDLIECSSGPSGSGQSVRGIIVSFYQNSEMKIEFDSRIEGGRDYSTQKIVRTLPIARRGCKRINLVTTGIGRSSSIETNDVIACGPYRGKVLRIYENNKARVDFFSKIDPTGRSEKITVLRNIGLTSCDQANLVATIDPSELISVNDNERSSNGKNDAVAEVSKKSKTKTSSRQ